jgi:hypothetical protein
MRPPTSLDCVPDALDNVDYASSSSDLSDLSAIGFTPFG